MSDSNAAPRRRRKGPVPKPPEVLASEKWTMRVHPEWLEQVRKKAKEWDVPASVLIRLMIDRGMEGDMLEREDDGESLFEKMRRLRRQK